MEHSAWWTPRGARVFGLVAALALSCVVAGAVATAASVKTFVKRSGALEVIARFKEADILSDDTDDDALDYTPSVTVSLSGRQVALVKLREAVGKPRVYIAEMDPANDYREVVVEGYTGGAHCCTLIKVASALPGKAGKWAVIDLGEHDGGWREPADIDGDGLVELPLKDDRFLYAYGCYACSYAPPRILAVRHGGKVDLTRSDAMRPLLMRAARELEGRIRKELRRGEEGNNGVLAGYVALKLMIGEGVSGWRRMLRLYERRERYEFCPLPAKDDLECPVHPMRLSFPLHLSIFLRELGYIRIRAN